MNEGIHKIFLMRLKCFLSPSGKVNIRGWAKPETKNCALIQDIPFLHPAVLFGLVLAATCASEVDPCSSWLRSVGVPEDNQLQPPRIQDLFFVWFCPSSSFFSIFCVAFLLLMVEDYPDDWPWIRPSSYALELIAFLFSVVGIISMYAFTWV